MPGTGSLSTLRDHGTVDDEFVAGAVARVVGCQEEHEFADLFGRGDTTIGIRVSMESRTPWPNSCSMLVSMMPGWTELTRTPDGASSRAADLVIPRTAHLDASVVHQHVEATMTFDDGVDHARPLVLGGNVMVQELTRRTQMFRGDLSFRIEHISDHDVGVMRATLPSSRFM